MATFTFGDFEAADAYDADPTIVPEQVERRRRRLRHRYAHLRGAELAAAVDAAVDAWLQREGPR